MSHSQGRENDDLNHDQLEFPEHDKKSKNPNHSQSRIKPTKFPNHLKHVEPTTGWLHPMKSHLEAQGSQGDLCNEVLPPEFQRGG